MNSNLLLLLFLAVFIFTTSPNSSAAKLASQKDQQINSKEPIPNVKISSVDDDSFDKLMGVEEEYCGNRDEECLMRRVVLEAHLDYIYTQKRIP